MKKIILLASLALCINAFAQVPSYVPTNGLQGWWPFSGNANDGSTNGYNGTVNGATLTTDRFGNTNSSYNFNGTNNYISLPTGFTTGSASKSFSVWFYLTNGTYNFVLDGGTSVNGSSFGLFWNTNPTINKLTFHGDGTTYDYEFTDINFNQWYHTVITYDGTTVKSYLNGVYIGSKIVTLNTSTTSNIKVGCRNNTSAYFVGKIDDIGVWNRALSACEVQDLFNAQLNSSTSIQAGTDVSICEGNDVIFNGSGGSNYTWNNGVQNGVAYTPSISQEYIVIGQDANNCYSTDTIYVELIPNTTATQTETALDSYTWPINSQTYTQSGTYTAVIPNAAGCDSTITLDLSLDFTGIEDNSQSALFSVFPNPAQSLINIKVDSKLIGSVYTIYDNTGRAVLTGKLNSKDTTIELNNLSGGIYMFSVGENMKQTFKVIKE